MELESLELYVCTPTPRISQYVQGDDADESGTQVLAPHAACRRSALTALCCRQIIVETNFRVYAYTTSYVDYQIISRFANVIEKFPDMCARLRLRRRRRRRCN